MAGVPREQIALRLAVEGGAVVSVEVESTRITHATGLLTDKTVDQALSLVPLLFALCGRAQAEAAAAALDAASARSPSGPERAARDLLVAMEAVDQHLRAVLVTWAEAGDRPPRFDRYVPLRTLIMGLPTHLAPGGWKLSARAGPLDPALEALDAGLRHVRAAVEDLAPREALERSSPLAGPAGEALEAVRAEGLAEVGSSPVRTAPTVDSEHVDAGLAGSTTFRRAPRDREGRVVEVGPFAAHRAHPAVAQAEAEAGAGVLARMVARLVDLHAQLDRALAARDRLGSGAPVDAGPWAGATGVGLGSAGTARGPLFHRVAIVEGRVESWAAVAPTEWNLQAEGALSGLIGVPVERAEAAARWLALALDPCVPLTVRLVEGR